MEGVPPEVVELVHINSVPMIRHYFKQKVFCGGQPPPLPILRSVRPVPEDEFLDEVDVVFCEFIASEDALK